MEHSEFQILRIGNTCSFMCVEMELKGLHISYTLHKSGKLEISPETSDAQMKELRRRLKENHIELVEAKPEVTPKILKN